MLDFDLVIPTKIYFGKNKEERIGEIIKSFGFTKVLIVIGQNSVIKSGLLDKVVSKLVENKITCKVFSGIRPNPTIKECKCCIDLAREFKPDLLLPIGGGSVIDVAKNVAVGYYYDGDSFDFNLHKVKPTKALPIGVILTIAASGSEMSNSCVIQNDDTNIKQGFNDDIVRPIFAIENPELTYSLPEKQTAYGIVDMIMHTFERYMVQSDELEPADSFAEAVLKNIVEASKIYVKNPTDYQARSVLMLMSSYSHNDLTNIGKKKIMPLHALEHCVSGFYPEVAHAAGLSVLFSAWTRYYLNYDMDKFDKLGKNVFGLNNPNKLQNGLLAIEEFEKLFEVLQMPRTFKDIGISNPDIDKLVALFAQDGTRVVGHHVKPLDKDVAREIFESCR